MTIRFECRTCGSAFSVPTSRGETRSARRAPAKITVPAKSIAPPAKQDRAIIVETVDPEDAWDRLEKRINGQSPGPPPAPDRVSTGSSFRPESVRQWGEADRAASRRWILWASFAAGGVILLVALMFVAVRVMLQGGPGRTFDFTSIQATPPSFSPPRPMPSADGRVVWKEVRLSGAGQPGQSGRLWIYLQQGMRPPRCRPASAELAWQVNYRSGMGLGEADSRSIVYADRAWRSIRQPNSTGRWRTSEARKSEEMTGSAYDEFTAAGAGIVNAFDAVPGSRSAADLSPAARRQRFRCSCAY